MTRTRNIELAILILSFAFIGYGFYEVAGTRWFIAYVILVAVGFAFVYLLNTDETTEEEFEHEDERRGGK